MDEEKQPEQETQRVISQEEIEVNAMLVESLQLQIGTYAKRLAVAEASASLWKNKHDALERKLLVKESSEVVRTDNTKEV